MIEIKNKKKYGGPGHYIGRPSPLGNPYSHIPGKGIHVPTREIAIVKYRVWLKDILDNAPLHPAAVAFNALLDEYRKTNKLILICWCFPLNCHAEVVRDFILERV